MNIKELKAALPYLFKAQTTGFIWGHGGVGKTTVVRQYAQDMGYKFFPFYLGTQSDTGDILGLAEFTARAKGGKSTDFAPPGWLLDTIDYCNDNPDSGAIIFLDEFNRARRDIIAGMFSFALDKQFHTIQLPKNCYVIAAGNPPVDEYQVNDVSDSALMARFVHIKLEPSFQEWVSYAKEKAFEPSLVSWLQEQPELLEDHRTDFKLPVVVDRRSQERVDKLYKVGTPIDLLEKLMIGIIGAERLVAYKLHQQNAEKPLTADQVMSGEKWDTIALWSNPTDIKSSLIGVTLDNVVDWTNGLHKQGVKAMTETQEHNMLKFLEILPRESAFIALRRMLKDNTDLFKAFINCKRVYKQNAETGKDMTFEETLIAITRDAKGMKAA